jgi:hypothetical protein
MIDSAAGEIIAAPRPCAARAIQLALGRGEPSRQRRDADRQQAGH